MLMDGAGNPFLEAAVPPPALPAPPPAPSMPENPTGFLPSFWQGFGLVALQLALVVLFMFLFRFLAMVTLGSGPGVAMPMLLSLLPTALSYLVVLWLGRRWTRLGWRAAFPFQLPSLAQLAAFLVLFAGLELASNGLATFVDGWLPPMPSVLERAYASVSWVGVVLVGPLFEELFFRGLILNGMRRRYSAWKAIGLSTLLFALSHANPWQLAIPLLIGAVFGWVVVRTGTLWLPVIGHAMHNGRVVLEESGTISRFLDPLHVADPSGWLAALLLTCAGAFLLARTTKEPRPAHADPTLADQALPVPAPSDPALGRPPPPRYPPPA
jgi:membrane protease YdiL (CAAX protease family)